MHWNEVWHGTSPGARLARLTLTPLSWLYAGVWEIYLTTYRVGFKKPKEPHCPVICVGNLIAGGSGKSPITLYISRVLRDIGKQSVLGCSGYGSPRSEDASIAPAGPLEPQEWGDEPSMMRWLSPQLPIIVGRDRVRAAELCDEAFPDSVLLMDDGFQHLPLKKHISILLDPPTGNRRCLPAGPYREPWRNRSRADLCLPNGFTPSMRIASLTAMGGEPVNLPIGSEVNVLCAIGDPARFLADLATFGMRIRGPKFLPDHHDLQVGNLFESLEPGLPIIVTAKDWVKLRRRNDIEGKQILIAQQEAIIEPETEFIAWLTRKLNELSNERPAS